MKRVRDPDAVRSALQARGLSHRELARLAGCSKSTVGFVTSGGRAVNDDLAQRIARFLRRPVDELFAPTVSTSRRTNSERKAVA